MNQKDSVVEFEGQMRVHVSLGVNDVKRSVEFYQRLWGVEPTRVRPGYAKFELDEPSVHFSLTQDPNAVVSHARGQSHFGIQLKDTATVMEMRKRWLEAGIETWVEEEVACCYSVQHKFWVRDPDGHAWEMFVVTGADSDVMCDPDSRCVQEASRTEQGVEKGAEQSCCAKPEPVQNSTEPCCDASCC